MPDPKRTVAIVGGGACAIMLASELDPEKFDICIYEKNAALGRKFLVAGYGGLNITHSEEPDLFLSRYHPSSFIEPAFRHFSNRDLITWLEHMGIETYVGSSGRVFPKKGIKPAEVLNTFIDRIARNKVSIYYKHSWTGFSGTGNLLFECNTRSLEMKADLVVFCLGGASWPVTGSQGDWLGHFADRNVRCVPFMASNCAFGVNWHKDLIPKIEGKALKNCLISCGHKKHLGEIVLTTFGIEGSGIYPLSPNIREQLKSAREAVISIDMKPLLSEKKLLQKHNEGRNKKSYTENVKTNLNLSDTQMALLKNRLNKEEFLDAKQLVKTLKNFEIRIHSTAPLDKGISTVGGIELDEINAHFELKKIKKHYAIGEMLNYDAPTGGYLLQSCFSVGKYLADRLNADN